MSYPARPPKNLTDEERQVEPYSPEVRAVAEAWASIDGKLQAFIDAGGTEDAEGWFEGYMSDARELLKRIAARGFELRTTR